MHIHHGAHISRALAVLATAPPLPRHTKLERAGESICESSRRIVLGSLTEERTISSALRLNNC